MSSIQKSFSLPPSINVANSNNNGGGGGGAFYMPQEEQQEQQPEFLGGYDDFWGFDDDSSNQSYMPPSKPLDRLLMPLKLAAAIHLYTHFPKDYDPENN